VERQERESAAKESKRTLTTHECASQMLQLVAREQQDANEAGPGRMVVGGQQTPAGTRNKYVGAQQGCCHTGKCVVKVLDGWRSKLLSRLLNPFLERRAVLDLAREMEWVVCILSALARIHAVTRGAAAELGSETRGTTEMVHGRARAPFKADDARGFELGRSGVTPG